jgi:hypothetical protein
VEFPHTWRISVLETPELSQNIHRNAEQSQSHWQMAYQKMPNSSEISQSIPNYAKTTKTGFQNQLGTITISDSFGSHLPDSM